MLQESPASPVSSARRWAGTGTAAAAVKELHRGARRIRKWGTSAPPSIVVHCLLELSRRWPRREDEKGEKRVKMDIWQESRRLELKRTRFSRAIASSHLGSILGLNLQVCSITSSGTGRGRDHSAPYRMRQAVPHGDQDRERERKRKLRWAGSDACNSGMEGTMAGVGSRPSRDGPAGSRP